MHFLLMHASQDLTKESRPPSSNGPLGIDLGPIGMTYGGVAQPVNVEGNSEPSAAPRSIHSMTTEQWRAAYERDGAVDLWVEEEFNAGSRLVVSGMLGAPACLRYSGQNEDNHVL